MDIHDAVLLLVDSGKNEFGEYELQHSFNINPNDFLGMEKQGFLVQIINQSISSKNFRLSAQAYFLAYQVRAEESTKAANNLSQWALYATIAAIVLSFIGLILTALQTLRMFGKL